MQQILYNMVNLVFTNYLFFLFHAANIIGSIYSITRIYVISMLHLRVGFISLFPRYIRNRIHEISFANRCRFVGKREDIFRRVDIAVPVGTDIGRTDRRPFGGIFAVVKLHLEKQGAISNAR